MDLQKLKEMLDQCPIDLKRKIRRYVKNPSAINHAYADGYIDALGNNDFIPYADYAYMLQLLDEISLNKEKLEIVKHELENDNGQDQSC